MNSVRVESKIFPELREHEYFVSDQWKSAVEVNQKLLSASAARLALACLPSVRRVHDSFQDPNAFKRRSDIHADWVNYSRANVSSSDVDISLDTWETILQSFQPYIETAGELVRKRSPTINLESASRIAYLHLQRRILYSWEPEQRNPEDNAWSITNFARSIISSTFTTLAERGELYRIPWTRSLSRDENRQPVSQVQAFYYRAVNNLTLLQLMGYVSQLDLNHQVAVLKMGGYFRPKESMEVHLRTVNISERTAYSDLKLGLARVINLVASQAPNTPRIDLRALASSVEGKVKRRKQVDTNNSLSSDTSRRYHTAGISIPNYASRVQILEAAIVNGLGEIDPKLLCKLTKREQHILMLSIANIDGSFIYSLKQVAEQSGLSERPLREILDRIVGYINGEERLLNCHDHPIHFSERQYQLIKIYPDLSTVRRANLTIVEQQILDFFCSPYEEGKFPSSKKVQEKFHISDETLVIRRIFEKLNDLEYVTGVAQKLEWALTQINKYETKQMRKPLFRSKNAQLVKAIKAALDSGSSMRSDGLELISRALNLPPNAAYDILFKEIPRKQKSVLN